MKTTLIIIQGLRAAVIAGLISAGTAQGIIEKLISEI
jgi:hypothetical protein